MKIPDIIDNDKLKVFQAINEILKQPQCADFASGYFNVGGYKLIKDNIGNVTKFRLLLGREPAATSTIRITGEPIHLLDKETKKDLEKVREKKEKSMNDDVKKELEEQEFTKENKDIVSELIDFINQDKVEVKL